jgi:hypothetical protein
MGNKKGVHGLPIRAFKLFRGRFKELIRATIRARGFVIGEGFEDEAKIGPREGVSEPVTLGGLVIASGGLGVGAHCTAGL